jgi:hypothetical protein
VCPLFLCNSELRAWWWTVLLLVSATGKDGLKIADTSLLVSATGKDGLKIADTLFLSSVSYFKFTF